MTVLSPFGPRTISALSWTRRRWLESQGLTLAAFVLRPRGTVSPARGTFSQMATTAERLDPAPWQALARQAVEAAHTAGARYAEARLTRRVIHYYGLIGGLMHDAEVVGVGVRALVDGYWGFSASTLFAPDEVARLAHDAVAQARANAKGTPWTVDLGVYPVATGTWATPVRIDPFTVPIEEKIDWGLYIRDLAAQRAVPLVQRGTTSWLGFLREERVVATSEGALFTQTRYESAGGIFCAMVDKTAARALGSGAPFPVHGLDVAGAGWELMLDAKIPEQFLSGQLEREMAVAAAIPSKPFMIGRSTLVCDGATMARLVEHTFGVATQLDRALGYEANARGTSFITDPLGAVGHAQLASPFVTVTANRSAPGELATVKWDDEGVEPTPFSLIKDGVLVDFQTTREQAAWLAPYYQQHGRPVHSHGCAATESAHGIPLQHMPNLALEPSASAVGLEDLIANVQDGILIEGGNILSTDSQSRTGVLVAGNGWPGRMRQIKNGRLGPIVTGGAVLYDSQDLWTHLRAVGGPSTQAVVGTSQCDWFMNDVYNYARVMKSEVGKGQPLQFTSHSVRAAAAVLLNQPLIDPSRKA